MKKFISLICFGSIFFSGCGLVSNSSVVKILMPPEISKNLRLKAVYFDENFALQENYYYSSDMMKISIFKINNSPVVVYFENEWVSDEFNEFPCGGLFPWDMDTKGNMKMCLENGFPAKALLTIWKNGISLEKFNGERFEQACNIKSMGNPWVLDLPQIIQQIAAGDFNVYNLKRTDPVNINIPLSEISKVPLPENPLQELPDISGANYKFYCYPGKSRYFWNDGNVNNCLTLFLDAGGKCEWYITKNK